LPYEHRGKKISSLEVFCVITARLYSLINFLDG
jgi:hypothetical protein